MNKSPNIILNNHLKRYNSPIKNENTNVGQLLLTKGL